MGRLSVELGIFFPTRGNAKGREWTPNHLEQNKWHESFLLEYQGTAYTIQLLGPLFRPSPPSPPPPACISTRRRVRLSNLSSHRFLPRPPVIFVRSWYLIAPAARFRAQRVRLKLGRNKELGGSGQVGGVAGPPSTIRRRDRRASCGAPSSGGYLSTTPSPSS